MSKKGCDDMLNIIKEQEEKAKQKTKENSKRNRKRRRRLRIVTVFYYLNKSHKLNDVL